MSKLTKRGSTWHLRMRVPKRYSAVELRGEIHRSLRTDSEREARTLLPAAQAAIIAELDASLPSTQASCPATYMPRPLRWQQVVV